MSAILDHIDNLKFESASNSPPSSRLRVREIKAVKIYYCYYGRNAWHSTWIQRYSPSCMHLTIDSAQDHAERKRTQGSVFYIEELPSLEINVGPYRVYITQINENCPLREYRIEAVRSSAPVGKRKIENAQNRYLKFGVNAENLLLSFAHDSRFWINTQPSSNSVMILYTGENIKAAPLKTTKLNFWKSQSVGKYYYLSWSSRKGRISQRSVLRLIKQCGFQKNAG